MAGNGTEPEPALKSTGRGQNLQFAVGDRVECNIGGDDAEWVPGTIIKLFYRERNWPKSRIVPYQARLDTGTLIFVPVDDSSVVRASEVAETAKTIAGKVRKARVVQKTAAAKKADAARIAQEEPALKVEATVEGHVLDTMSGLTLQDFQAVSASNEEILQLAADTTTCPAARLAVAAMLRSHVDDFHNFHLRSLVVGDATEFRIAPAYMRSDKASTMLHTLPLDGCLDNMRPATKNSVRCRLHTNTDRFTPQGEVAVKEAWCTLRDRSSVCDITVDELLKSFARHTHQMQYCVDCKANVEDAFDILIGQEDEPEEKMSKPCHSSHDDDGDDDNGSDDEGNYSQVALLLSLPSRRRE